MEKSDSPQVLISSKNEIFVCTCQVPRQNVVRGTRKRPHLSTMSSPDVPAAVVEVRGLQNLKQISREKQNKEQDLYRRGDAKFLQRMSTLGIKLKQGRNPNIFLPLVFWTRPESALVKGYPKNVLLIKQCDTYVK